MKTSKKILLGGLGALSPIIMNLLVVDLEVLLLNLTIFSILGYMIRVIVLFYLGGIVAFLHKDENSPVKIFELGIVAPALITALLNAGQIEIPQSKLPTTDSSSSSIILISSAYAQAKQVADTTKIELKTFSMPEETKMQQFWRGLIGLSPKKGCFVIVGIHEKLEDAQKQVNQIVEKTRDFKPEIYAPFGDRKGYSVVIGANLSQIEARKLQKKALDAGLPRETHIWIFAK